MRVINLFIYKLAFKLNRFTGKLKARFHPGNKEKARSFKNEKGNENGFYAFELLNRKILSPLPECFTALYQPIFDREIYAFKPSNDHPLIIDCGANIGMGIIYWKTKYPNARIIAFEPSIKVLEALKENVKAFDFTDVEIINAALSDSLGEKEFTVNEGVSGSLVLEKKLGQVYKVKTVRLDSYLTQRIDFLKVDIEGEEVNIFPQIARNLNNIHNLFIEYHSFVHQSQRLSMFLEELEKNGFRYYIEGEYKHQAPLYREHINMSQDLQVGVWAKRQ